MFNQKNEMNVFAFEINAWSVDSRKPYTTKRVENEILEKKLSICLASECSRERQSWILNSDSIRCKQYAAPNGRACTQLCVDTACNGFGPWKKKAAKMFFKEEIQFPWER